MTANAASLLAEIRRSGGHVRMTGPDTLKLVAPAALLPKLAERVRAVKPLLLAALEEGNRKAGAAQLSGGGVLNPRRAAATVQHLTVKSSSDRAIPTSAVDWPARYHEALARRSAFHPADEAKRLAWSEIENDWHTQYGQRVPRWQCAGCSEPIGGLEDLMLGDGNRVHLHKLECLLRFGERWRNEATAGLRAFGLDPPQGFDAGT